MNHDLAEAADSPETACLCVTPADIGMGSDLCLTKNGKFIEVRNPYPEEGGLTYREPTPEEVETLLNDARRRIVRELRELHRDLEHCETFADRLVRLQAGVE